MKLSVFIASMLTTLISFGQQADSIGHLRKPVLVFLIGEHYRAEMLSDQLEVSNKKIEELMKQLLLKDKMYESMKQDSVQAGLLLGLEKQTGESWKRSFEVEKKQHRVTKSKLLIWKLATGAVVVGAVFLMSQD